jgi:hypothetical protein
MTSKSAARRIVRFRGDLGRERALNANAKVRAK